MSQPSLRGTVHPSVLRAVSISVILFMLSFAALWVWYAVVANYDYDALSGSYSFREGNVSCTLRLAANRTFHQEITMNGRSVKSDGVWSRYGEGRVAFANLLAYPFTEDMEHAGGSAPQRNIHRDLDGEFVKALTVFPKLEIQGYPVLRKEFFTR